MFVCSSSCFRPAEILSHDLLRGRSEIHRICARNARSCVATWDHELVQWAIATTLPNRFSRHLLFVACLIVYVLPALIGLTVYPAYYEDESWVHLATFEALRGNGFSWAAFHEGTNIFFDFNAIAFAFTRLSALPAEATVRAISILSSLFCLTAVYLLARHIAGAAGFVAPLALITTPLWFLTSRYGRQDAMATAFAMWALAVSRQAPLAAGALTGIAASIHPVFVWIVPVCIVLIAETHSFRQTCRYLVGCAFGAAPQAVWTLVHLDDVRSIAVRYLVTSGVSHGLTAWVLSLETEWRRYAGYAAQLSAADLVAQAILFVGLPVTAVVCARGKRKLALVALVLGPLLGLAALVQGKNPYYLVYVLPCLAVVAAAAAQRLPMTAVRIICVAALLWSSVRYVRAALDARHGPTVTSAVESVAARLPPHAILFSPLTYGSLVRSRSDVQFFTYHALSLKGGFRLPPCEDIPATIGSLIDGDRRPTSRKVDGIHDRVFFLKWNDALFLPYLQSIYVQTSADQMRCIVGPGTPDTWQVCGEDPGRCLQLTLIERTLR